MKKLLIFILVSTSLTASELSDGVTIIKKYGKTLKQTLKSAIKKNGVIGGLDTCNLKATHLTENFSKKNNVKIGRTSLKIRNLHNSPTSWMKLVLKEYKNSSAKNKLGPKVVSNKSGKFVVAPLYMGAVCLKCHGQNITGNVLEKINKLYPEDKAKDYKLGEFRGLVWLKI